MKITLRLMCGFLIVFFLFIPYAWGEDTDGISYTDDKTWLNVSGNNLDLKSDTKPVDQLRLVQKLAYIKGLYEALAAEEIIGNTRSKLLPKIPQHTPEEIVKELDDFYSHDGNGGIPVINSLIIINEKNRGASKERLKKLTDDAKDANLNIDRLF